MVQLPARFIHMGEKAVDRDQRGAESGSSVLFFLTVSEPRLSGFFAKVPIIHLGMGNTTIVLVEEFSQEVLVVPFTPRRWMEFHLNANEPRFALRCD